MSYRVRVAIEGTEPIIDGTFKYRYYAIKAAKIALKKGWVVIITKVDGGQA